MKKWILCLPEDNALVERIRTKKQENDNMEIYDGDELQNLENIQEGDLVYLYLTPKNPNAFHEVYAVLERNGYNESKDSRTLFEIKELNN